MGIAEKTENKVFAYIEAHGMIVSGDRIVAGVSGGADSLCLLFLLLRYAEGIPLKLGVVHVDHGVRPDSAEDARYVEELCRRRGLPFFLRQADVPGLARAEKCSQEDAGRRIRYEAFRQAAQAMGGAKVAVAHNSNDNAETMLFHLFRGSGLKGLCGIAPVRDGIIRPILCLERREAEAYLEEKGIAWRRDSTNEGDDYSRNRIRHHILPYAERELFCGAAEHMRRTAELLEETEAYLEQQTRRALETCLTKKLWEGAASQETPGRCALDAEAFLRLHPALRRRALHMLLKNLSPTGKDIGRTHVEDALKLFLREGNKSVDLPFGIIVRRQYDVVILERAGDRGTEGGLGADGEHGSGSAADQEHGSGPAADGEHGGGSAADQEHGGGLAADGEHGSGPDGMIRVRLPEENTGDFSVYDLGKLGKIEFTAFLAEKREKVLINQYTKWFDYDKIGESLVIRTRRRGDYLTISDGRGGMMHKSLKDYMVTEKIPRQQRDEMLLLAAGSHVVWLIGRRISEAFKVDGNTRRILRAGLFREESGDRRGGETEEKDV